MIVCIIATICKESGALSIYKQFLSHLKEKRSSEDSYYIFIDPQMPAPEMDGVCYIRHSTKGFRRILFDLFGFKQLCKRKGIVPDVIFSLNNSGVKCSGVRQIMYYHQLLALCDNQFSLFKKSERRTALYTLLYSYYVALSLKKNTSVVVQTPIVKRLFVNRFRIPENRITVAFPDVEYIDEQLIENFKFEPNTFNFLYPATGLVYKEHITIVRALQTIDNKELCRRIRVHFTITATERKDLYHVIKELGLEQNFVFHGAIPYGRLLSMYKSADGLLFPSTIETIGLPLLEAASFGLPVVANDLDYVNEVLRGYEGLLAVPLRDYRQWGRMMVHICGQRKRFARYKKQKESDWTHVLELIKV